MTIETFQPGTIKPEADYLEIARLGAKLGIPVPMMYVKVEATNPDGSPGDRYEDRSRTFNRNFWNSVLGFCSSVPSGTLTFAAGFLALKTTASVINANTWDITGSGNDLAFDGWTYKGLVSDASFGVVVGTGTGAESFEGVALGSIVAQGNGAGQMAYSAGSATGTSYDSGTKVWTQTLARVLNNNSGGTIVVAETGLYGRTRYNGSLQIYMVERSLLGGTVSVLTAGQLTVTYTMQLTFPN